MDTILQAGKRWKLAGWMEIDRQIDRWMAYDRPAWTLVNWVKTGTALESKRAN